MSITNNQVIINVNDAIIPPNIATIDKDGMSGNAVSKEQFNENFNELKTELQQIAVSNYKGILLPTDPEPTEDGSYKAGVSSKDNIDVDPNDYGTLYANAGNYRAKEGYITYFYKNGSEWSKSEDKLPGLADVFDPDNDTEGITAFQTNDWLVNGVEGGEGDAVEEIYESVGAFFENIGATSVGGSNDGLVAGLYQVKTNLNSVATEPKFITKAHVRLTTAGNFKLCIGTWNGTKFTIRWQSPAEITGVVGWNVVDFNNQKIYAGEMAAILCISSTAARIAYATSGGILTNRFAQYSTSSGSSLGGNGSYYSLYFELNDIDIVVNPIGDPVFNLSKSVSKIVDKYTKDGGYKGIGFTKGDTVVSSESTIATGGYAINKIELQDSFFLEKLEINPFSSGTYTIVIGLIDQFGKFIEQKSYIRTLSAGINVVNIEEVLNSGDYIGLKFPSKYPINSGASSATLWATTSGYNSELIEISGSSLPIKLFLNEYIKSNLVTDSNLDSVKNDITSLQQKFVNENTPVKLIYNVNGSVSWSYSSGYSSILHLGNSLAVHPITSFWWGTWGMAASEKSKDYVHQFEAKMKVLNPSASSSVINIAAWESNPSGWDKTQLNTILSGKDLIIVRLGENATFNANYKTEFGNLINHIKTQNPTAKIVIGGVFWADANKDTAMSLVASENQISFVPLSDLGNIAENKSAIGNQVYGDDGQLHTINNSGVAAHPGDLGMSRIADRLFNSLGL